MKRFFGLLGLFSLVAAGAASAAYVDGMALRRYCEETDPFNSRCTAYIAGVLDSMDHARCLPKGTGLQQVARAVRDHLDTVADPRSQNAAVLVKQVLNSAYPCR